MSMPASSWSFTARIVASIFACSSAGPATFHGAHRRSGSASHSGFGRLPAIVVRSMVLDLWRVSPSWSERPATLPRSARARNALVSGRSERF
jgi:hypothetical protein